MRYVAMLLFFFKEAKDDSIYDLMGKKNQARYPHRLCKSRGTLVEESLF